MVLTTVQLPSDTEPSLSNSNEPPKKGSSEDFRKLEALKLHFQLVIDRYEQSMLKKLPQSRRKRVIKSDFLEEVKEAHHGSQLMEVDEDEDEMCIVKDENEEVTLCSHYD